MRAVFWVLILNGCGGPPAADVDICRDVIARVCGLPVCSVVATGLSVADADCTAQLLARTGCGSEQFAFVSPLRTRVLDCRLPLVRDAPSVADRSSCESIEESFLNCPDLVTFLSMGTP